MEALHAESDGEGPLVVLAHGFTQTGRLFGSFGPLIGHARRVVSVDLPGHGGSSEIRADLDTGAQMLVAAAKGDRFDLVGYSLGARFALHAALAAPASVQRLVLISATAGIEDGAARAQRRLRDEAMAEELEASGDVPRFVESWLAAPMFATLRFGAGVEERQRNSAAGLASSLRLAGVGTQTPLWDRLATVSIPVLAIAGATDPRYQVLAARIARTVSNGTFALVPGAGHAAHLEQPRLSAAIVTSWLSTTPPAR